MRVCAPVQTLSLNKHKLTEQEHLIQCVLIEFVDQLKREVTLNTALLCGSDTIMLVTGSYYQRDGSKL
jgi:hypothetical protein